MTMGGFMTGSTAVARDGSFQRTLTTPKIVFLVVAAAAPMAAIVGTVPLAFALGDGAGFPALFVLAGLILLCFSTGYAAISRRVVDVGGFYTYISAGLGRPPAVGGGLIALIAYNASTIGLAGAFGYFVQLLAAAHGVHLAWEVWTGGGLVLMALLGYRQIDLSVKVLSLLMVCEMAFLAVLDAAVLHRHGRSALPTQSFDPHTVFGGGLGVGLMFAFICFIGFESAALYGEETRNPQRSVPLATYSSVVLIAVFYAATSWIAVGAIGPGQVAQTAGQQLGGLFIGLSGSYLGQTVTTVMQVMLCTSLFASMLAMHNAADRYLFVLGRDRILPGWLAEVHPRHRSPHRASLAQSALTVLVVAAFALAGLDPYLNLATTMIGIGTLAIIVLQAAAALSVIGFFRRRAGGHWWRTGVAPALGFLGLGVSAVLVVANFATIAGTTTTAVTSLPWLLVAAAVGGVSYALWLRARRPERYAVMAAAEERAREDAPGAAAQPAPR